MVTSSAGPVAASCVQAPRNASRRVRTVNAWLDAMWASGVASRPSLDPAELIRKAERRTGLADFGGDSSWRSRLDGLAEALEGEACLNAVGRTVAHGQLVAALAGRLRAEALLRHRMPDDAAPPPIIIMGQMRSGSTRVQRLLASDPRLAATRFEESWTPVPARPLGFDERHLRARASLAAARWINPAFSAIHPTGVGQPEEEFGLHAMAMFGSQFEAQWRLPSFARLCETMDAAPVYRDFARYLGLLRHQRPGGERRPWVLKLPQFTQDAEALLAIFPDARLVVLDRDPAALIASSASLVFNQMTIQSDEADRHWIGREWLHKIALRRQRMRSALAGHQGPVVELAFDAVGRDWRTAMRRTYRMLGMDLTRDVEARMAATVDRARSLPLGAHSYHLESFGLTAREVAERMRSADLAQS